MPENKVFHDGHYDSQKDAYDECFMDSKKATT